MEKFPILCTLSAVLVFLGATLGVAGVQTVKKNDQPFGLNSVEQIQRSVELLASNAAALHQDSPVVRQLASRTSEVALAGRAASAVQISGELLVSF